jgi:MoaA/NifB/PqqE/SkfB family radical SAM enzyme
MSIEIKKNRDRVAPTFANINLLGECNANCYFCLGKDICEELKGKNQLDTHYTNWKNFPDFLSLCAENNIKQLYLTGQTADGLQYKYLKDLVIHLQHFGFTVGVRTNGYLAIEKMRDIQLMKDEIGYSIHSLDNETNKKIMGRYDLPDWDKIIPASGDNVRVSIVLNRYNVDEFFKIVGYLSTFENVRYIQVRRISTDTRVEELQEDIDLYEEFYEMFKKVGYKKKGEFFCADQYEVFGKEVNFWRTVETSANSFNYFTDGTISDEYFIVEGYLKNKVDTSE